MKKMFIALQFLLSIIFIVLIFNYIGFDKFSKLFEEINANPNNFIMYFALGLFFYLLVDIVLAWRTKRILEKLGEKISFIQVLKCHFLGMLMSDLTPARTGYFMTAFSLSNYVPLEKGMVSILGPQMFDFSIKVIGSVIGAILILGMIGGGFEKNLPFIGLGILIIFSFIIVMLLLLFSERFLKFLEIFEQFPIVGKLFSKVLAFLKRMQKSAWAVKEMAPEIFAITLFSWGLKTFEWYFLGLSIGIHFDIYFYAFLQTIMSMMQFVPTPTVAGAGVAEAGAILLLGLLGISETKAFAYSILTRLTMLTFDTLGLIELRKTPELIAKYLEDGGKH